MCEGRVLVRGSAVGQECSLLGDEAPRRRVDRLTAVPWTAGTRTGHFAAFYPQPHTGALTAMLRWWYAGDHSCAVCTSSQPFDSNEEPLWE